MSNPKPASKLANKSATQRQAAAQAGTVRIVGQEGGASLSKAQKQFNTLIKNIDEQRARLLAWQEAVPLYQARYNNEAVPLQQTYNDHARALVYLFDNTYDNKALSKTERAKIVDIISPIILGLLQNGDQEHEDLKKIYNKYNHQDDGTEEARAAMMEEMLGVEPGEDIDIDFDAPEQMAARIEAKLHEEQMQREQAKNSRRAGKKTAKQLAKEAQQQQDEQNISQSIREVYRKLASALHPDREPDAAERERKTVLMQRVNVAYGNKNLLQLLELQLETEQISPHTLATLAEDRLLHYNKILKEQLAELLQEIREVESRFQFNSSADACTALSPASAIRALGRAIAMLKDNIDGIKMDLRAFQDIKNLKAWLKQYRIIAQDDFY